MPESNFLEKGTQAMKLFIYQNIKSSFSNLRIDSEKFN